MIDEGEPSQAADGGSLLPPLAPFALSLVDAQPIEPPVGSTGFTTVVIGASAGGVDALRRFFGVMPADSGCAFVVVTHLARDRDSMLAALLGRATPMPTLQIDGEVALVPNHVYVSAPGQLLEARGGRLVPRAMLVRPPKAMTVDHFMVSIAADQRDRVIGIVLSGADGDGALGVKAIKGEGGFTIAQKPQSAAHSGMPQSAVATGVIDAQLDIEEMPAAVLAYVQKLGLNQPQPVHATTPGGDSGLAAVLTTLRSQFGIDFSGYKTPMLLRRMHRRMALNAVGDVDAYQRRISEDADEARALRDDFLINVTEFFREPESWTVLAHDILPALLQAKEVGAAVRVWVAACSTGEEAYGIAMLLLEQPLVAERRLKVQVFGTDVDAAALEVARKGQYAHTIEPAVGPDRLRRFFLRSSDRYAVRKDVRSSVLFAAHDLTKDPPFSRMDLVSCRNVLIYMDHELQRRVLQTLHFALADSGYLALGKSESAGAQPSLFNPVSNRARLFRRAGAGRPGGPVQSAAAARQAGDTERRFGRHGHDSLDFGALLRRTLLGRHTAAAVLTDRDGQALYFHGAGPPFLQQPSGEPTVDLFVLLDEGLRAQLRAALHRALQQQSQVEAVATLVDAEHAGQPVRLTVVPVVGSRDSGLLVVCFERIDGPPGAAAGAAGSDDAAALRALEEQLRTTKRELSAAIEELEAANQEMKVANEEATSMNEELQSSNEELETSKEEMQSINEELTSVNEQLQTKVQELERVNDDIGNLLTSTHIPTLFLDRALRIKRYTPAATQLFRLLPADVERPLSDIASDVDLPELLADVHTVLRTLAPVQRETRTAAGEHWLRRTLPYRARDEATAGAVVTFTDVTQVRQASEGLRRFAAVMQATGEAMVILDLESRVVACNPAAERLYAVRGSDLIGSDFARVVPEILRGRHAEQTQALLAGTAAAPTQETLRLRADGTTIPVASSPCVVPDEDGRPQGVAMIERDISLAKATEAELRRSETQFRALADNASVLIFTAAADGLLRFVNAEFCTFVAEAAGQLQGRRWVDLFHADDQPAMHQALAQRRARDGRRVELTVRLVHSSGRSRWMKLIVVRNAALADGSTGWTGSMIDIDDQVASEQALQSADRRKDEFLAMLGHELRNPLVPIRNAAAVLDRVAGGDPRIGWVRDTLVRQVGHVTRLVDDLLDISMVTRGTLRLHMEPLELRHIIEQAIDSATPLLQTKRHKLQVSLPDEPVWLQGDTIRLTQVFDNLLTNAAKYTDDGGDLSIAAVCSGEMATVTVADNGLGIAPGMLSRIFDLFVQDERSVDRSQGGLGIGLALVRRLVDLHGGTVHADSEGQGKGSELVVRLPLLREGQAVVPADSAADAAASGGRVLIVDDDVDGGKSLMVLLRLFGYDAEYAADLPQALEAARRQRPQAVLMDIAMPQADGYEVAARLRALPELDGTGTAYIAITGFTQPEDYGRSKGAGFVRHLVKPVDPAALDALLRSLIDAPAAGAPAA